MDITTLSLTELKALAYDQFAILENTQRNLQTINIEIAKRNQPQQETSNDTDIQSN